MKTRRNKNKIGNKARENTELWKTSKVKKEKERKLSKLQTFSLDCTRTYYFLVFVASQTWPY